MTSSRRRGLMLLAGVAILAMAAGQLGAFSPPSRVEPPAFSVAVVADPTATVPVAGLTTMPVVTVPTVAAPAPAAPAAPAAPTPAIPPVLSAPRAPTGLPPMRRVSVPAPHPQATTAPTAATRLPLTSTQAAAAFLRVAQSQLGLAGPYTAGGYWCAKFVSWAAAQARVPGFVPEVSPAKLEGDAQRDGRMTTGPKIGGLVFIDLMGTGGLRASISHVGVVATIAGNTITTIEGNGDDSGTVDIHVRTVGDGYVVGFATI